LTNEAIVWFWAVFCAVRVFTWSWSVLFCAVRVFTWFWSALFCALRVFTWLWSVLFCALRVFTWLWSVLFCALRVFTWLWSVLFCALRVFTWLWSALFCAVRVFTWLWSVLFCAVSLAIVALAAYSCCCRDASSSAHGGAVGVPPTNAPRTMGLLPTVTGVPTGALVDASITDTVPSWLPTKTRAPAGSVAAPKGELAIDTFARIAFVAVQIAETPPCL